MIQNTSKHKRYIRKYIGARIRTTVGPNAKEQVRGLGNTVSLIRSKWGELTPMTPSCLMVAGTVDLVPFQARRTVVLRLG
jgi:hypothetical protein